MIEQTAQKKMEIEKAANELSRIQIESKQQIAQAEAQNEAIKLQADAKAYQIRVEAQAQADAIKMRAEALKSNPELVDFNIHPAKREVKLRNLKDIHHAIVLLLKNGIERKIPEIKAEEIANLLLYWLERRFLWGPMVFL